MTDTGRPAFVLVRVLVLVLVLELVLVLVLALVLVLVLVCLSAGGDGGGGDRAAGLNCAVRVGGLLTGLEGSDGTDGRVGAGRAMVPPVRVARGSVQCAWL